MGAANHVNQMERRTMGRSSNLWPQWLVFGCVVALMGGPSCPAVLAQSDEAPPFDAPVQVQQLRPLEKNIRLQAGLAQQEEADAPPVEKAEQESGPVISTRRAAAPVDDQQVQLQLWDGSLIGGKLQVQTIGIQTEFGRLEVPIGRIRTISPGLDSYPELRQQLESLVAGLDDKDFEVREQAQRELVDRGLMLRKWIQGLEDQGSAERKKRLGEITREIDVLLEEMEDGLEGDLEPALINGDTVETETFSIVGRIEQQEFEVQTPFGALQVALKDIKQLDRTAFGAAPEVRKNVTVHAEAFFQREPVSTRIRVEKGDEITVRGSGVVHWTNWNATSTPEGLPNQGQHEGINAGTLVARIGNSGKLIPIGEKHTFRAPAGGVLYLGIAVQDNHANNNGYRWTGSYKARVLVVPGQ